MKIIVLGAGQVGRSLAENLVAENHDIVVVDKKRAPLDILQNRFDLQTVRGHCSYPDVLREAGAESADMILAVTDSDESNMVACQVAYSLFKIPTKIARIRSQHYFIRKELFGKDNLPIDVFISPEALVTKRVQGLIEFPGSLQVLDFAEGRLKLVAVKPFFGGPLLGKKISEIGAFFPKLSFRVVAIYRGDHSILIKENTSIEIGDEVFFIAPTKDVKAVMTALRNEELPCRKIMIGGGGNIGYELARTLEKEYEVKIIERSKERCEYLARRLEKTTVFCGDATDSELLLNENIEYVDAYCAMTDDDENNILSSLQAKKLGARQVMALVARATYVDLIEGGPINIAFSPQLVTVSAILKYIRRGDIAHVYALRRGAAEAMELVVHGDEKSSKLIGRAIKQIKLPTHTTIGALVRGDTVILNDGDAIIEKDDHVVLFVSSKDEIRDIERLFSVKTSFL